MTSDAHAHQQPGPPSLSINGGQATIQFNRPAQHNRIEPDDLDVLMELYDRVANERNLRVMIIRGAGKSFSSGFHIGALKERKEGGGGDYDPNAFEKMVDRLEDLPVPTIAAMNGGVYGGSTDLALACDFRIGVEGMRMFMPAARLGIVYYESGLRRYVSRIGLTNAKRLFLTAQPFGAQDMLAMGYLDELVPPAALDDRVAELAAQIASNAPMALAETKRALNATARGTLDSDDHMRARERCAASEDHQEGLRAWAEKRAPKFVGQ